MNNGLKVSFYLKRESRLEKSSAGEKGCLPNYWQNHHRQQHCPVRYQTESRGTALACQIGAGNR